MGRLQSIRHEKYYLSLHTANETKNGKKTKNITKEEKSSIRIP
jgi:hypothetical protein